VCSLRDDRLRYADDDVGSDQAVVGQTVHVDDLDLIHERTAAGGEDVE